LAGRIKEIVKFKGGIGNSENIIKEISEERKLSNIEQH
jgi:hypothetical protein